ncbi:MAG: type III secretion system export apparatus subunit SctS [Herminiimonas sp.]|nr:type III secretion system export apparatus subunit SctS [Herminiimonas sp.]
MEQAQILQFTHEALMLALLVSLPAVILSAFVGLVISFVQAVTSLQEQSVSQGAKLVAVTLLLVIAGPWGGGMILRFGESVMKAIFQ